MTQPESIIAAFAAERLESQRGPQPSLCPSRQPATRSPIPCRLPAANRSGHSTDCLDAHTEPGGLCVADLGYAADSLFRELDGMGCRFVVRAPENAVHEATPERPLTAADVAAGVVRDVTTRRLGTEKHNSLLERPLRIVEVRGTEPGQVWVLATSALALSAELIAQAYHCRWQIELFCRGLKCILGCRHLLSQSESGVRLQVNFVIIASLRIGLWTGAKPNQRTYEMLCFHLSGWATAEEVERHLNQLHKPPRPPQQHSCRTVLGRQAG